MIYQNETKHLDKKSDVQYIILINQNETKTFAMANN